VINYEAIAEGKEEEIQGEKPARGGRIPLGRSVLNANHRAYRRLSGLIGFRRPMELGLYRPRLFLEWLAMAYRLAYQRPGPLGTLPTPLSTPDRLGKGEDILEEGEEGEEDELVLEDALLDSGYRILSVLGHENLSTTYLAKHVSKDLDVPGSPQLVAIKQLKRPFGAIGENEYSLLQHLYSKGQHPRHIIFPISYFLTESGHFDLVPECLDSGRPISLMGCFCEEVHSKLACPARHLSLKKIILQLLSGLLSPDSHNLIHSDLTHANMLFLPSSSRIKLIDLGNTIHPEDREGYLDDFGVQSVCYCAPEIILGLGRIIRVIDVWSASVIAVALLLYDCMPC